MVNKQDLRIVKAKKALFEALITLMEETSFEKIKISDICEAALINRSTFYAHYEDKYDLLLELIQDLKNNLENELKNNKVNNISKEYFMELLRILIDDVDKKKDTYSAILTHNKNGILIDFLIDVVNRDLTNRLKYESSAIKSNIPINTVTEFYLGGIITIGVNWITNKNRYKKEELLSYLDKLIPDKI